jgi:hypothetical protein
MDATKYWALTQVSAARLSTQRKQVLALARDECCTFTHTM